MKKIKSYTLLSKIYDKLMEGFNYSEKSEFIIGILKKFNVKKVLDLACGTGNITTILSEKGFDCYGIDNSQEMLNIAKKKSNKVVWLNQDIKNFKLNCKFDAVICIFDSLNYLIKAKDIIRLFNNVHKILNNGGVFLFDINTPNKKLKNNEVVTLNINNVNILWKNIFKKNIWIAKFFLNTNNKKLKFCEIHKERLYTKQEIISLLNKNSFHIINIFENYTFKEGTKSSPRLFFIVKKKSINYLLMQQEQMEE